MGCSKSRTKREQIVLGIDPSTVATGWAVVKAINNSSMSVVDCGTIKLQRKLTLEKKLLIIYDEISNILCSYNIDAVACENPFFHRNAHTFATLTCVKAVVMLAATQAQVSIALYAPAAVKSYVLGQFAAKSDKEAVAKAVNKLTAFATRDFNQSDAIAVALTHLGQECS